MNSSIDIKRLTVTGMLTAVVTLSTMAIRIPVPVTGGYIHPGDGFVILAALILGPVEGTLAAGLGSAFADVLGGYFIYAPATFVIKALSAFVAYYIFKKSRIEVVAIPAIFAELVMVAGYFLFESALYNPAAALAGILPNITQGLFGIAISTALYKKLSGMIS